MLIEGAGGTYLTSSMTAGGYQTFVSPGVYTVTAYGGSLPSPMVVHDVVVGGANVKVDFEYDPAEQATPLVDLNGPGEAGSDFQTTYFEGAGAVPIVAAAATLENSYGDRPILTLTATITNHLDPEEVLAVDTTGAPIVADYDAPAGILTLSGSASAALYQQVLRTLVYDHLGSDPNLTPRQIEIVAFNGAQSSSPATVTVNIVAAVPPEVPIDELGVVDLLRIGDSSFRWRPGTGGRPCATAVTSRLGGGRKRVQLMSRQLGLPGGSLRPHQRGPCADRLAGRGGGAGVTTSSAGAGAALA